MLVAGNICNYIRLSKEPPGLEEIPGMWDHAALWEQKWKLCVLAWLSALPISSCLYFSVSNGVTTPLILGGV